MNGKEHGALLLHRDHLPRRHLIGATVATGHDTKASCNMLATRFLAANSQITAKWQP
jgi:hypothetical protein